MISLLFVFGTVIEFILVLILKQIVEWAEINSGPHEAQYGLKANVTKERLTWKKNSCDVAILEEISPTSGNLFSTLNTRPNAAYSKFFKGLSITSKIDYVAFAVFVSLFFVFNCTYFVIYL